MIRPHYDWRLPEPLLDPPPLLDFSTPVATLLARRGFSHDDALLRFLSAGDADLHALDGMADAEPALARIERVLADGETIAVWGDYDADGITAVAIWTLALRAAGSSPLHYVPSRLAEGYGVSKLGLVELKERGASLVITSDCGVANLDEAQFARSLGLDLIVTDHHLPGPVLPAAAAVVDPHRSDCRYPNPDLTGAGVAFKLATELLARRGVVVPDLVALAAIGTVADVAPLTGENRAIVRLGLDALAHARAPGLRALLGRAAADAARPTWRDLAFGVAPRINAAGRIADARLAVSVLLAASAEEAERLADELETVNRLRQALTRMAVDGIAAVDRHADATGPLVVRNDEWPPGILGLVASRLLDTLRRPIAAVSAAGDELRGSVRAPGDFHAALALRACAEHLTKLGGHPSAGGFSLSPDCYPQFVTAFSALPRPFPADMPEPRPPRELSIDLVLSARHVGWDICGELERLAPYGPGHPEPVVAISGLVVGDARPAGPDGRHLTLRMLRHRESFDAVLFELPDGRPIPESGTILDLVATLERDRWMGEERLRLRVHDYADAAASPLASRTRVPALAGASAR